MDKILLVAAGGAAGSVLRYLTVGWVGRLCGHEFPWGTALVNVLGSFVMGVAAVTIAERLPEAWLRAAPLVMTGLLGGYTTFSAFSLDVMVLLERGRLAAAAGYVAGSVLLALLGLAAGLWLAREVWPR